MKFKCVHLCDHNILGVCEQDCGLNKCYDFNDLQDQSENYTQ